MKDYILDLDKSRELRFGFKATRAIRNKFGEKSLEQLLNIKWDEIPVLVWAGLRWEDKQLTVDQVEDLLDDAIPKKYTILKITETTLGALAAHMGIEIKKAMAGGTKTEEVKEEATTAKKKKATETIPSSKTRKK